MHLQLPQAPTSLAYCKVLTPLHAVTGAQAAKSEGIV